MYSKRLLRESVPQWLDELERTRLLHQLRLDFFDIDASTVIPHQDVNVVATMARFEGKMDPVSGLPSLNSLLRAFPDHGRSSCVQGEPGDPPSSSIIRLSSSVFSPWMTKLTCLPRSLDKSRTTRLKRLNKRSHWKPSGSPAPRAASRETPCDKLVNRFADLTDVILARRSRFPFAPASNSSPPRKCRICFDQSVTAGPGVLHARDRQDAGCR